MSRWQGLKDYLDGKDGYLSEYSFLENLLKDIEYIAPGEYFPSDSKTIDHMWSIVREKNREKRVDSILNDEDGNFVIKLPDEGGELEIILDYVNRSIGVKKDNNTIWIEFITQYSWNQMGPQGVRGITPSIVVNSFNPRVRR